MGWKNFQWTFCNSIHSVCVLQCAESETLAVGSKGVALPCKFRNSGTAVSMQMWLATLRNLPIIHTTWTWLSVVWCQKENGGIDIFFLSITLGQQTKLRCGWLWSYDFRKMKQKKEFPFEEFLFLVTACGKSLRHTCRTMAVLDAMHVCSLWQILWRLC